MNYELHHEDHPDQALYIEGTDDGEASARGMDYLSNTGAEDGIWYLTERVYDEEKADSVDERGAFYRRPVREYSKSVPLGYVGSYAPGELTECGA